MHEDYVPSSNQRYYLTNCSPINVLRKRKLMKGMNNAANHSSLQKSSSHDISRRPCLAIVLLVAMCCISFTALSYWMANDVRNDWDVDGDTSADQSPGLADDFVNERGFLGNVERLSRPFHWDGSRYGWCIDSSDLSESSSRSGMFFVKVMKTASSTGAGVTLRVAINTYHRIMRPEDDSFSVGENGCSGCCKAHYSHGKAIGYNYTKRDKSRSFLWSTIRLPRKRAVSHVFFKEVSRRGMEPSDQNIIRALNRSYLHNYQVNYLKTTNHRSAGPAQAAVRNIIRDYDFLAVAERMDESLVAMKMILNLDFGDFIYLSSKVKGGYDDGKSEHGCVNLVPSRVSEKVDSFLSTEFRTSNQEDNLLYRTVNRSLDKTIDQLGKTKFEAQLERYRMFLKKVQGICEESTAFPCSPDGVLQRNISDQNCYFNDWGCGYPCFDQFILEYSQRVDGGMRKLQR